jgi:4-alpha-glucanotransferase
MGVNLIIGIHNHQPVGNFPWVFEDAFERSYGKFLDILMEHPEIRLTIHNTGPLFDWIEENRPQYIRDLNGLVSRGQVEIMGGAYYEPIISIIPEVDAVTQIEKMSKYIKDRFQKEPKGMWLAERVWEPTLPRITNRAEIEYTLMDDTHFRYSGIADEDLFGYYLTEYSGHTLAVFPIDKGLRYTIPFKEVGETIARLKEVAELKPDAGIVYGDDGEKFGLWPGTYDWVYKKGWLEELFSALKENSNWINLMTFSEYMGKYPPAGRVYLPTASYPEMAEWALPPKAILNYKDVTKKIEDFGFTEEASPFIRGGIFNNFLTKYPESNNMQKRTHHISKKLQLAMERKTQKIPKGELLKAQDYLMASMCNCAYWHGLFGGLYLNYLRHANYENMCKAEKIIDGKDLPTFDIQDINRDGADEILIGTKSFTAYVSPAEGGTLYHLDLRDFNFCLTNTLSRTFEAYHEEVKHSTDNEETEGDPPASIHDKIVIKEEGMLDLLIYDRNKRYSFIDRIFTTPPTVEELIAESYVESSDFSAGAYEVEKSGIKGDVVNILLKRRGNIKISPEPFPIEIKKVYNIGVKEPVLKVKYTLSNLSDEKIEEPTIYFAPELNFTLLGGDDPMRYLTLHNGEKILLKEQGEIKGVDQFSLINEYDNFEVSVKTTASIDILYFGVHTVSQSEGGVEKTYQGNALTLIFPVTFTGKEHDIGITISVSELSR